jgi:hypothetical protein
MRIRNTAFRDDSIKWKSDSLECAKYVTIQLPSTLPFDCSTAESGSAMSRANFRIELADIDDSLVALSDLAVLATLAQ